MSSEAPALARCCLGEAELQAQVERYRRAGRDAVVLQHNARRIELRLDPSVQPGLVEELLAVERGCCPFFELEWEIDTRRLAVSVSGAEQEGALAAVVGALGLRPAS